jgi:predicted RNase H-like HicB family nuclease
MRTAMELEFRVPVRVRKRGKWFVSSFEPLDVHSQGRSRAEAERNLKDALASFLVSCFQRGTLDQVLRDAGFVAMRPRKPRVGGAAKRPHEIAVPLPFRVRSAHDRAAAG